jgi:hypothetical protein
VAKSGNGDLRQQLATIFEDEGPRSLISRLFNSALALLIIVSIIPRRRSWSPRSRSSLPRAFRQMLVKCRERAQVYSKHGRGLTKQLAFVRIVAEPFLRHCRMTKAVTHR